MYLINPLYFISNVIYIRPESKYILIDKPCWNTMVKLIFKGRRPSVAELKQFKELCYSTYVVWMDTKMIDYKSFNAKISQYQLDSEKFRKWSQSVQNAPIVEPVVEIDVNDDTFYEEEFIYEDKTEELNLTDSEVTLLNKTTTIKKYEEDAKYIINYNLVRSPQHKSLVEIIGFGKIIALCRLLVQNKSLRFLTSLQQKFFHYNSDLVANALKIYDETLWYSCSVCSTINTHEHHRRFDLEAFNSDHTLNSIEFFYRSRSLRNRKFVIMLPKDLDFSLVKFNPVQLKENFFPIIVTVEDKLTLVGMQLHLNISEPGSHPIEVKVERDIYYYFYQFYMMKYVRDTFYDEEAFGFLATQISSWIQRSGHFNRCVYESMIPLIKFFQLDVNYFMVTFGIDPECLDSKYDNYKEVIKLAQLVNIENPFNAIINVLD